MKGIIGFTYYFFPIKYYSLILKANKSLPFVLHVMNLKKEAIHINAFIRVVLAPGKMCNEYKYW